MSEDVKYCADCAYHHQVDGWSGTDKYHSCYYDRENNRSKRDIISGQFPLVTCKSMREGICGKDGGLFKAK